MPPRVLLLLPTTSYKAQDFMAAAERLGVEVVVGTDHRQALESTVPGKTLTLDLLNPERAVEDIVAFHRGAPIDAVVGVDDEAVVPAAMAAAAVGLRHNPPDAAIASRDKRLTRQRLQAAGMRAPPHVAFDVEDDPAAAAVAVRYPCVLKPLLLSASRGVLRANDPAEFAAAFRRIAAILARPDVAIRGGDAARLILVEDYIPGREVALEGLLEGGRLRELALFDKPDPMEGPTFPETLFVTPSRLPELVRRDVVVEAQRGCDALGLTEGPVHAELRIRGREPWLLEMAARTIGGLCARTLRFGAGISLEEIVLRRALGMETAAMVRETGAAGVLMIPVPRAGVFQGVRGIEEAREVPGIVEIDLTVARGADLEPLPEGNRYIGFLFAKGPDPSTVETTLREASGRLTVAMTEPAETGQRSGNKTGD